VRHYADQVSVDLGGYRYGDLGLAATQRAAAQRAAAQ
jgi:hypothetical protein